MTRHRRVKREKAATLWTLLGKQKPPLPCTILLTRISTSPHRLDDDNLTGSLKAIRDAVATWLGINDAHPQVKWLYAQASGNQWGVQLEINSEAHHANR